jgi:hypothetical protein
MLARHIIVDQLEKKAAELTDALELLVQSYDDTLQVLGSTLELKDAETEAHCQRVAGELLFRQPQAHDQHLY